MAEMEDKQNARSVGVVGRLLRLAPRAAGLHLHARLPPCPSDEVNDFPSYRARNLTEAQEIQALAERQWPNTFRLHITALGQPVGLVTRHNSLEAYMGRPMVQTLTDTCALVACTVCLEAVHRREYDRHHRGKGPAFPCSAAAPYKLLIACLRDGTWTAGEGAYVGAVLTKIQQLGGVPATTAPPAPAPILLPLRAWQEHRWDDDGYGAAGLSPERVAALLDGHGPCVGVLWVCPWYDSFDAGRADALVYRGCGRSEEARRESRRLYGGDGVGSHAVVCFAYRFCGEQMHVLVMDNHDATGPRRWVDVEELDTLYTLSVERLDDDPPLHLGDR